MHCIKCGGEVPEDSKFCHHCGAELKKDWNTGKNSNSASNDGSRAEGGGSSLRRKALVVGLIAGVVLSILALSTVGWSLGSRSPSDSSFSSSSPQETVQEGSSDSSSTSTSESESSSTPVTDGEISSVSVPKTVDEGESSSVTVDVKNTGETSPEFRVELTYSGTTVSEESSISPGSSASYSLGFTPTREDSTLEIKLYADGDLLDSRTVSVTVKYVDGKVMSVDVPSEIEEGQTTEFSATIKNSGNKGGSFQINLKIGNSDELSEDVYLSSETSNTVSFEVEPDRHDSSIEFSLEHEGSSLDSQTETITVTYPVLSLTQTLEDFEWSRGKNDLPSGKVKVDFTVTNEGTGPARDESITLTTGDGSRTLETISYLAPGDTYEGGLSTSLESESSHYVNGVNFVDSYSVNITLEVGSESSSQTYVNSRDRYGIGESLYVTPDDPVVQSLKENLLDTAWYDIRADWKVLSDWVKTNITYTHDDVLHESREYWQLPRETIRLRKGDCEDKAILLTSLLRACGYNSDEVYAVASEHHVWVTLNMWDLWGYEYWRTIEPTDVWSVSGFDFLYGALNMYGESQIKFNDVHLEEE